jgi:hypothetical protein
MIPIHPVEEKAVSRYIGMPVCAVLQDGTRHYGILSRIEKGKLILNESPEEAESANLKRRSRGKAKTTSVRKGAKAKISAFPAVEGFPGPYPYGYPNPFGGRIVLDLAAIALLFLLFV